MSWGPNYYQSAPPQSAWAQQGYPAPHAGYPITHHPHPQGYAAAPPPLQQQPQNPFIPWFRGHLVTLTFNSRPIISTLTTIALERRDKGDWANMQVIGAEIDQAMGMVSGVLCQKASVVSDRTPFDLLPPCLPTPTGPAHRQAPPLLSRRLNLEEYRRTVQHRRLSALSRARLP